MRCWGQPVEPDPPACIPRRSHDLKWAIRQRLKFDHPSELAPPALAILSTAGSGVLMIFTPNKANDELNLPQIRIIDPVSSCENRFGKHATPGRDFKQRKCLGPGAWGCAWSCKRSKQDEGAVALQWSGLLHR